MKYLLFLLISTSCWAGKPYKEIVIRIERKIEYVPCINSAPPKRVGKKEALEWCQQDDVLCNWALDRDYIRVLQSWVQYSIPANCYGPKIPLPVELETDKYF